MLGPFQGKLEITMSVIGSGQLSLSGCSGKEQRWLPLGGISLGWSWAQIQKHAPMWLPWALPKHMIGQPVKRVDHRPRMRKGTESPVSPASHSVGLPSLLTHTHPPLLPGDLLLSFLAGPVAGSSAHH